MIIGNMFVDIFPSFYSETKFKIVLHNILSYLSIYYIIYNLLGF